MSVVDCFALCCPSWLSSATSAPPVSMSGHNFGAADAPPPEVAASASLCVLYERSIQARFGTPLLDNEGESTATSSPFSYVGCDLSWELSNEWGGLERGY